MNPNEAVGMQLEGRDARWLDSPSHRSYLLAEARSLLRFFRASLDASGRFVELDDAGAPLEREAPEQLLTVARAVHSYALGELAGVPGGARIVERGLDALEAHRDPAGGGYLETLPAEGDGLKSAYGHAFVILAASSAMLAGHDRGEPLLEDALVVFDEHFWSDADGAARESFDRGWREVEPYRGANANMHLCEAYLAAGAATGRVALAERARRIAERLIDGEARRNGWLLPEHYDATWTALPEFHRDRPDDPFRPYGVTPGHLLEWSRLCVSVWLATGQANDWLPEAARALFEAGTQVGWDAKNGGLVYTADFDGAWVNDDHYWWPIAEGIAASAVLARLDDDERYARWYRSFWEFAGDHLIDDARGGWFPQLDRENRRTSGPWYGKPDLYHALQACLIPATPASPSVAASILAARAAGTF